MKTIMAILVAALPLAACAIAQEVPLPEGKTGYAISACNDMAECYRKAAKVCGGKYEIVSQGSGTSGSFVNGIGAVSSSYTITVKCPD